MKKLITVLLSSLIASCLTLPISPGSCAYGADGISSLSPSGILSIPAVNVGGNLYAVSLRLTVTQPAARFSVIEASPAMNYPANLPQASLSPANILSIPNLSLAAYGMPGVYEAKMRLLNLPDGLAFELTELTESPAVDPGIDPGGVNPLVAPLLNSGNSLAIAFGNALGACGYRNHNTTPDHWGEVALIGGTKVCSVWTPPGWNNLRMGEGVNILYEDPSGRTTVTSAGGTSWEITDCSLEGVTQWWLRQVHAGGCTDPDVAWYAETTLEIAGIRIPAAYYTFSCNKDGVSLAGLFQTEIHSQGFPCLIQVAGYMLPADRLDSKLCTLYQILNSLKCPEDNGYFDCTKPQCSLQMKQQGYAGGYCNSFEQCVPVQ